MVYRFKLPKNEKNVREFYRRLYSAIDKNHLTVKRLGKIEKLPILYLERRVENQERKVLIAAGFHGNEVAGPWGLLSFLESGVLNKFKSVNVSFLPLVNPTGMKTGKRLNVFNKSPNSGFCHNEIQYSYGSPVPSHEGKMLLKNLKILLGDGLDGFLTLHEDFDEEKAYIYTFENSETPGFWSKKLRDVLNKNFEIIKDGVVNEYGDVMRVVSVIPKEGALIKNGIIFNHHDGTFEDRLFHEGVPFTACTETPGKKPFRIRVKAVYEVILSFLEH